MENIVPALPDLEKARLRRFAARLVHARRSAGLQQAQAAKALKFPIERLRDLEASLEWPTSEELDMVAEAYGVEHGWLMATPPYDL